MLAIETIFMITPINIYLFTFREVFLETWLKRIYFYLELRIIIVLGDGRGVSDVQNRALDTSFGLLHKIKQEHLHAHFNIVPGDSVIKIVSEFPCVLLFWSSYNLVLTFCSGRNLAYSVPAFR